MNDLRALDHRIATLLSRATIAAVVCLAIGLTAMLVTGHTPLDAGRPFDLGRLVSDVLALEPEGFLWLGVLITLAAPPARLVVAILGLAAAGRPRRALVSVAALIVLAVGLVAGLIRIQ